ncbi:MAG: endonuclease/exonuclease/phosphatase family protein [Prevotella sp.]|nr:endonuclease/exonuclease/phosphatase family protein [Prevotella sp.]
MIKQLKQLTINIIAGANIATALLMLLTGYSDRLSPVDYPWCSWLGMVFPVFVVVNLGFLFFWLIFKWRKAWIPVVGFIFAYIPISTYMPLNPRQEVPDSCIKVLTYNVCSYGGNYKYKDAFERILDYLKEQQADIVCIQEDVDTWRRYMMVKYEKIYPYNDTTIFRKGSKSMNGIGIHTRYPILRKERIQYESSANGSVAYYLKRGSDTLLVINNHLECTHLSSDERNHYRKILKGAVSRDTAKAESKLIIGKLSVNSAKRAVEVEAVKKYIDEHRQYPVIVCGDFNDTPISYTHHVMVDGLEDCFQASGRGIGLSYNQKGFWVRIDHIFCSDHFTPYNCQVDSKIDFSDHYPVLCWLKMQYNP